MCCWAKVWAVRVDLHVLDHDGNLVDACALSALAALLAFRRPAVEVGGADGQQVLVHSPADREPAALSIHHLPLAVTFALYGVSTSPCLGCVRAVCSASLTVQLFRMTLFCTTASRCGEPFGPSDIT